MKKNAWCEIEGFPELMLGQYVVPNFVSNSVAVHDGDGNWTLLSPGASLLRDWKTRFADKAASVNLVMPNHYHYMGVASWLEAYPDARLFASRQAIGRLGKLGIHGISALESSLPALPDAYRFYFPPGHRAGDVWLCKLGGKGVWITCDSFLNYTRLSNQPLARLLQKMLGAAPGLKMSQVVKWFILTDRRAFKAWAMDHLEQCPPGLLIPGHGEPERGDDLAEQLKGLLEYRL